MSSTKNNLFLLDYSIENCIKKAGFFCPAFQFLIS